jgi:DNA-directed RNA polymerase subunit M/transcription elongation factor TFIIS
MAKSNEPPKGPAHGAPNVPLPKCRRCKSAKISIMGRMEQSKETLYQCGQCGFVFTAT